MVNAHHMYGKLCLVILRSLYSVYGGICPFGEGVHVEDLTPSFPKQDSSSSKKNLLSRKIKASDFRHGGAGWLETVHEN